MTRRARILGAGLLTVLGAIGVVAVSTDLLPWEDAGAGAAVPMTPATGADSGSAAGSAAAPPTDGTDGAPHAFTRFVTADRESDALADTVIRPGLRRGPGEGPLSLVVDGDREIGLPLEALFVLPGETVELRVESTDGSPVTPQAEGGRLVEDADGVWLWTAPEAPGAALRLAVRHDASGERIRLNAFVMVPADQVENGRIGDYRIGSYPLRPLAGNPIYDRPDGFVEVNEETRRMKVAPHFRLGAFTSKQSWDFPKYVVIRPELLLKLELLLEAMADRGYPARSFHIMSGYRTPYYNVHVLDNVKYSRHQWGGAADIFVDERPENGRMDDLDGDGRVDLGDIRVIREIVDSLESAREDFPVGGLGVYRANSVRGPFVHLDVRGSPARW